MLFDESIFGIPLTINWRWVMKVVADMKIIKITVISLVWEFESLLRKVFDRFAPKNFASCADASKSPFQTPCGTSLAIPFRTVNSAKKIGA